MIIIDFQDVHWHAAVAKPFRKYLNSQIVHVRRQSAAVSFRLTLASSASTRIIKTMISYFRVQHGLNIS